MSDTITVEIEFTRGVVSMLRRRGFLAGEATPSNVADATIEMLLAAVDADVRAKPEPAPQPEPSEPPPVAERPPAPAAPPRRAKATKASPPPAPDVEELAEAEPDTPRPPPVQRTNGADTEAEAARARWLARMAAVQSLPPDVTDERGGPVEMGRLLG